MSGYTRNGVTYNSEEEADLAAVIPSVYVDRPLDAGYIAEAILDSDWLAGVKAEARKAALFEAARDADAHFGMLAEPARWLRVRAESKREPANAHPETEPK